MMTKKTATAIATSAFNARRDPRDFDSVVRTKSDGTGWAIPHSAFTDGDDQRSVTALAAWIRRTAVSDKPLGRPAEMDGGKRVNVYLDAPSLARAAELGGGNVSEGIRAALHLK
jgi:hypothetical protein